MMVTLVSTLKIVELNGIATRIWEGRTEAGVPVHAFIPRLGVAKDADQETFRRELQAVSSPSEAIAALPSKMVLESDAVVAARNAAIDAAVQWLRTRAEDFPPHKSTDGLVLKIAALDMERALRG